MTGKKRPKLLVASPEEIAEGKVTDIYFIRTREILEKLGIRKRVRVEIMAKSFPRKWPWALFAGLDEVLEVMEGHPVTIRSLAEGTPFGPYTPVMEIEGDYLDFGIFETAILGCLCQASGIATAAARIVKLADGRPVISFGARRMHPVLAPLVERNAYIGGCTGVSAVKSAEVLGLEPTGTMPHTLILIMGDTVEATRAFHEVVDPKVPRVSLVDTFNDEKFESLAVAEALGQDLNAVRLDTASSRRGDFLRIFEEVRWELDLKGHTHVKLFASGGLNEGSIVKLNTAVDAYGVGTAISGAPTVDYSLDIVEVDGVPVAKRGKMSGSKDLYRCPVCRRDTTVPRGSGPPPCGECGGKGVPLLETVMEDGRRTHPPAKPEEIRQRVIDTMEGLEVEPI